MSNESSGKKPVIAGGGIIYRYVDAKSDPELLLIYRLDCWDLPKGKKEDDESIRMCAAREVSEELGIPIPSILAELGQTYHEYEREGTDYAKTTYWYAMFTPEEKFTPQIEEDIEKVEWFPLSEAQKIIGYENLKSILVAFQQWYKSKKTYVAG